MAELKKHWILILLTAFGAFLHFYNLSWGEPYHFHPDERNVASAVSQLQFPHQMNPNFFAYGSLPIYTVFFTGLLQNAWHGTPLINQISFEQAIMIGRMYSALFATILIPLLYIITKQVTNSRKAGLLTAALMTFSTGIIQFAHFGTFEMWLTFFTVLLFWTSWKLSYEKEFKYALFISLVFGILMATKVSSLALLPIALLAFLLGYKRTSITQKQVLKRLRFFLGSTGLLICITGIAYALTNPFVILDTPAFLLSMNYESSVGLNTLPVFYTQGFYDTVPVLYQFTHIYPFLINPLMTLLLLPSFIIVLWLLWKTKNIKYILLITTFLIVFLSQAVLFIKWTRYMTPTLPFLYLIIVAAALYIATIMKLKPAMKIHMAAFIIGINSIFAISYFITAFVQPDTRVTAAAYAKERIPTAAPILTEIYDIGITAFNADFPNIILFNTYDLDSNSPDYNEMTWKAAIQQSEYIILPSQRVVQTRLQNPDRFPTGNAIYASLFNGKSGFTLIYETPCDIFCQITYLGDPVLRFEQTANVFDRPTVYILQKKAF